MKAAGRQLKIRDLLESREFVDLETLCRELEASESSVRRDLIALEGEGVLRRVYGGAMAIDAGDGAPDLAVESTRMAEEKRRIGALAATLVENGQTVILDGGTTMSAVAQALTSRSLHVITNSLAIAEIFAESRAVEVTLAGGFVYPRLRMTVGPMCEQMLSQVTADVLIMGIGGVTEAGYSNNNTLIVGPERRMIEAARKTIVVADHTKFGRGAVLHVAPLDAADVVVSDSQLAPEYGKLLESRGVDVLLA